MKNHSLLYFLVFICSLVLGYSVSTRFYRTQINLPPASMRWVAIGSQNSIQAMNNGQRSILLIGASSINTPNPRLESIWLATYFSSDTAVRLLPIFPSGNQPISAFEQQLNQHFNLDHTKRLPVLQGDFLNVLRGNNYWWSGYIVYDEVALARIIDLVGGIDWHGTILSGDKALMALPKVMDDPQAAYSSQMTILQATCRKLQEISADPDAPGLGSILSKHILTDLDPNQLQTEIQSLFANVQKPTCSFPMLEISQVNHE